jgi:gamma-tubulin complex component 5
METDHTSDEDSEPDEPNEFTLGNALQPSYSPSADGDFIDRIDKMTSELESLVKFIRRGTENLAGGAGEAAGVFGVLAFALEDWDL